MAKQLVWLITGTSTGLGRDLTLAALQRGDKVIATARARSFAKLDDLEQQGADVLEMDVTAPLETLHEVAKKAVAIHGRVDVVVNNAGYIEAGTLEEITPEETFNQFNTNVFAPLNVNRAFLPYMRERKAGTIVWVGSVGGWRGNPVVGLYSSTKYAVRCLSEALHKEIQPLGLRSLCFEFGYFRTAFLTPEHRSGDKARIPDYAPVNATYGGALAAYSLRQPGDPRRGVEVVVDVVRGEGCAADRDVGEGEVPLVLALGSDCYKAVREVAERKLEELEVWKEVTCSTDFPKED